MGRAAGGILGGGGPRIPSRHRARPPIYAGLLWARAIANGTEALRRRDRGVRSLPPAVSGSGQPEISERAGSGPPAADGPGSDPHCDQRTVGQLTGSTGFTGDSESDPPAPRSG